MKKLLVISGVVACCSSEAMEFRRGAQLPVDYLNSVHRCAIEVNRLERGTFSSASYQRTGVQESMCIEGEDSVICAFPEEGLAESSEEEVADSLTARFYDKEIIVTGYRKGGEFAASVAATLNKRLSGINQIKSITFCSGQPQADLSNMALTCRLNFSHAYSRISYRSKMLESLIPWSSEIRSRLSKKNVILGTLGLAQSVLSVAIVTSAINSKNSNGDKSQLKSYAESLSLCAGGVSCLYKAGVSFLKTPKYLPVDGVTKAFKRLKYGTWGAMDEREFREAGMNGFYCWLLCTCFGANAEV